MSSTSTRRRPARDDVRRALLDAAAVVFARRGIDAASMDEVASAAGFTKGALYSNFASKDALVEELADEHISAYVGLGMAAVADTGRPLTEQAQALGDRLTSAMDDHADWNLLFIELWARAVRHGDPEGAFLRRRRDLHRVISDAVAEHAHAAEVELRLSPDEVATLLMALANGLAIERSIAPGAVAADLFGRALAQLLR